MNNYDNTLDHKEKRFLAERNLLKTYQKPLLLLRCNLPIELRSSLSYAIAKTVTDIPALMELESFDDGYTKISVIDQDAVLLKTKAVFVEETHTLGRLLDLDVIDQFGTLLHREVKRNCFVCGEMAHECVRLKKHTREEILLFVYQTYGQYLSEIATAALTKELDLENKPGLVTPTSSGSHLDMNYTVMKMGIESLKQGWVDIAVSAFQNDFQSARNIGKVMEHEMLKTTGGVNTHKGAIFIIGSLIYGHIRSLLEEVSIQDIVRNMWKEYSLYEQKEYQSHGKLVSNISPGGILAEARSGFYNVFHNLNLVDHELLIQLLATVNDSNIIYRAGTNTLELIQNLAKNKEKRPIDQVLSGIDKVCKNTNASPGGVADLLSAVYFMQMLSKGRQNAV